MHLLRSKVVVILHVHPEMEIFARCCAFLVIGEGDSALAPRPEFVSFHI